METYEEKKKRKEESQRQQKIKIAQDLDDTKYVMCDERGRRFVSKLIARAGVYGNSFTGQSNSTMFNEGARREGLRLLKEIKDLVPGFYLTMLKEEMEEKERKND